MSGAPAEPRLVITPNSALPGDREKPQRYTGGLAAGGSWAEAAAAADVPTWVVNKEPTCLTPALYAYLLEHTREPAVLQELREETARLAGGWMQVRACVARRQPPQQPGCAAPCAASLLAWRTMRTRGIHPQIAPEQGQLLALLAEIIGARQALDVGLFTGGPACKKGGTLQ